MGITFKLVITQISRVKKYGRTLQIKGYAFVLFEFYSHSPFWGTIIWVVINRNPVMSQLVRVDQGMIHVAPKVQGLMEDKDIPFVSERVAPCVATVAIGTSGTGAKVS